jgi:hypothetical protein
MRTDGGGPDAAAASAKAGSARLTGVPDLAES